MYSPHDMQNRWEAHHQKLTHQSQDKSPNEIATLPSINLEQLNSHYKITPHTGMLGKPPRWLPIRAFNDGKHQVFIQMPPTIITTDAPALFVISPDGNRTLVNYRIRKNWYIVDNLFKQAILISGTGSQQQRVTITYTG